MDEHTFDGVRAQLNGSLAREGAGCEVTRQLVCSWWCCLALTSEWDGGAARVSDSGV